MQLLHRFRGCHQAKHLIGQILPETCPILLDSAPKVDHVYEQIRVGTGRVGSIRVWKGLAGTGREGSSRVGLGLDGRALLVGLDLVCRKGEEDEGE